MLTGHADLEAAIASVNEGHVFRFLTKPCDTGTLITTLEAAIAQYRLITAEKELLHGTLGAASRSWWRSSPWSIPRPSAVANASSVWPWPRPNNSK